MGRISSAKAVANRKNAKKSTGPKTKKGKEVVKWNALKHGLLAQEVVIRVGEGEESEGEFRQLFERLNQEHKPVGVLEEILVERIAVCYWRLRRVIQCETGEIRKRLDSASVNYVIRSANQARLERQFALPGAKYVELQKSGVGLQRLLIELQDIRGEIESEGKLSDLSQEKLMDLYGSEEDGLAHTVLLYEFMANEGEQAADDPDTEGEEKPNPDNCRNAMLKVIDMELARVQKMKKAMDGRDEFELDSENLALRLPPKDIVDKILRYETTLERQLYRAIDQLERLQRARKGDAVPPPINVQVSSDN